MPRLPLQPHRQHQRRPPRVRNRSSLKRSANPTRVNLKRWHDPNATRGADRLESLRADNWQSSSRPFGWKLRRLSCFSIWLKLHSGPMFTVICVGVFAPLVVLLVAVLFTVSLFGPGLPPTIGVLHLVWLAFMSPRSSPFEAPQYAVVARRSVSCRIMPAMPLRPHGQYQQSVPRMRITTRTCFPAV